MTAPKTFKPEAKGVAASTDLAACTEWKLRPFPWRHSDLFSGVDTPKEVLKCRVVNYENGYWRMQNLIESALSVRPENWNGAGWC